MLEIKGINFNVNIEKKKIKNIYLRVKDNTIYATCPFAMPDYKVYNFISTKRDWIYNVYLYNKRKSENSLLYRGGDTFYIFTQAYKLIRTIGNKRISITSDTIYFTYKDDSEEAIKALYKYTDKTLLKYAHAYLDKYRPLLIDYGYNDEPLLSTRIMSSKWGCCFTRKNKINISSYLIHYPLDCLEYIILHEVTHFIIPNHSERFYTIIKKYMPNYKEVTNKLK